jgi:hypothetical protein
MFFLLILLLAVAVAVFFITTRRQGDLSTKADDMKERVAVGWQRVQERGKEDYEDLKAELQEEQELRRKAAAEATAASARNKPL